MWRRKNKDNLSPSVPKGCALWCVAMTLILCVILRFAHRSTTTTALLPTIKSDDSFECLVDEPKLWERRVEINKQFQSLYCDGKPLDRFVDNKQRGYVPVVFVYSIPSGVLSDSTKNMITLALNTAAKFNPRVFLLLFGDSFAEFNVANNVEIVRVFRDDDPVKKAFDSFSRSLYEHHSKNPYEYELFCFQRWFAISAFLQLRKFQHVFVADNDVLLTTNVTAEAEACYVGCKTFGKFVYSTYMRTETVFEFCAYITAIYKQQSNVTVMQILEHYPVVSDMNIHQHFLRHRIVGNITTEELYAHPTCVFQPSPLKTRMLAWKHPFDGGFYAKPHKQLDDTQMTFLQPKNGDELLLPHLYQVLHFQGARKKMLQRCKVTPSL